MRTSSIRYWQLSLGIADLAATRFAISPLYETGQALGALRRNEGYQATDGWMRWAARQGLAHSVRTPLLDQLAFDTTRPSYPEFLTPSPGSLWTSVEDEIELVTRTRPQDVAASLARVWHDGPLPAAARRLLDDPAPTFRAIAAELLAAHDALIRPHWSRLRSLLEADVAVKARRIAQGGFDTVFSRLHPDAIWDGTTLRVGAERGRRVRLSPGGLILAPTVFGPPTVTVKFTSSTSTVVRYPARGAGAAFLDAHHDAPSGLAGLIGAGRARVLTRLATPSSPTQLAAELDVTPSAVVQHLRVLREGGLVRSDRVGRSVVYALTATGAALLAPDRP